MHEPQVAIVNHKTGKRIRLKVPAKKRDRAYFFYLSEKLLSINGVTSVKTNPATGSVLLMHSSDPDHILQLSAEGGFFKFQQKASAGANLQGRISETFEGIDLALRDVSGDELDVGGAAFLVLLALGGYQIIKGNFSAVPWYAAGWYALNIFLKSNNRKQSE